MTPNNLDLQFADVTMAMMERVWFEHIFGNCMCMQVQEKKSQK